MTEKQNKKSAGREAIIKKIVGKHMSDLEKQLFQTPQGA
jgi:hypothetical protein